MLPQNIQPALYLRRTIESSSLKSLLLDLKTLLCADIKVFSKLLGKNYSSKLIHSSGNSR